MHFIASQRWQPIRGLRRRFRPEVLGLESRELLATAVTSVVANHRFLTPPNNRFVSVEISGAVIETRKKVVPNVRFQVSDEYRRIEPSGPVHLTRIPGANAWTYKFPVVLQAKRSNQDTAGRHYYVLVGTSDLDNSQGITIPVLVPFKALKPGEIPKSTAEHPTKAQLRRLPVVNLPTKAASPTSGFPTLGSLLGK